jgi:hypothetical protein
MTSSPDSRADLGSRMAWGLATAVRVSAALPIPILVAMFLIAPSYTTQLVRNPIGWLVLLLAIAFTAGAYGVNELAVRLCRKGKVPVGAALIAASTVLLTFPALWLVLIGPALVVFIEHPS